MINLITGFKYIVALDDCNMSYEEAAFKCEVEQSSLSGMLISLSGQYGELVTRDDRDKRKRVFTPRGRQIVGEAREVLRIVKRMKTHRRILYFGQD